MRESERSERRKSHSHRHQSRIEDRVRAGTEDQRPRCLEHTMLEDRDRGSETDAWSTQCLGQFQEGFCEKVIPILIPVEWT